MSCCYEEECSFGLQDLLTEKLEKQVNPLFIVKQVNPFLFQNMLIPFLFQNRLILFRIVNRIYKIFKVQNPNKCSISSVSYECYSDMFLITNFFKRLFQLLDEIKNS